MRVQFEMEIWSKPWDLVLEQLLQAQWVVKGCQGVLVVQIARVLHLRSTKTNRKNFRRIVIRGGRHVGIAGGAQRPSGGHPSLKTVQY